MPAMARLIPCSSCGRHVRSVEASCPFCGRVGLVTPAAAPGRLSAVLLGLCLAACAGKGDKDDAGKTEKADTAQAEADEAEADTAQAEGGQAEGADDGAEVDPDEPDPRPTEKYGAPPPMDTGPMEEDEPKPTGTDDGAVADPPEVKEEKMKTKYGAPRPRPAKKYGAPPPSSDKPDF